MSTDTLTFAAWLRGRRAEKRLTRDQLSAEVGISVRQIATWENEEGEPIRVSDVRRLARWAEIDDQVVLTLISDVSASAGNSAA